MTKILYVFVLLSLVLLSSGLPAENEEGDESSGSDSSKDKRTITRGKIAKLPGPKLLVENLNIQQEINADVMDEMNIEHLIAKEKKKTETALTDENQKSNDGMPVEWDKNNNKGKNKGLLTTEEVAETLHSYTEEPTQTPAPS